MKEEEEKGGEFMAFLIMFVLLIAAAVVLMILGFILKYFKSDSSSGLLNASVFSFITGGITFIIYLWTITEFQNFWHDISFLLILCSLGLACLGVYYFIKRNGKATMTLKISGLTLISSIASLGLSSNDKTVWEISSVILFCISFILLARGLTFVTKNIDKFKNENIENLRRTSAEERRSRNFKGKKALTRIGYSVLICFMIFISFGIGATTGEVVVDGIVKDLMKLNEEKGILEAEYSIVNEEAVMAKSEVEALAKEKEETLSLIESRNTVEKELAETEEKLKVAKEKLKEELASAKETLEKELIDSRKEVDEKLKENDKEYKAKVEENKNKLDENNKEFKAEIEESNKKLEAKRKEGDTEIAKIEKELEDKLKEIEKELGDKRKEIEKKVAEAEKEVETAQGKVRALDSDIASKQAELEKIGTAIKKKAAEPIFLNSGHYIIGRDIPIGRYQATNVGQGSNFVVYNSSGNLEVNTILGNSEVGSGDFVFFATDESLIESSGQVKLIPVE